MSDDPGSVTQLEPGVSSGQRVACKGPFILAKLIISYLEKKKQVSEIAGRVLGAFKAIV